MKYFNIAFGALALLFGIGILQAETDSAEPVEKPCDTAVHISGQWFFAYRAYIPDRGDHAFGLKRGYLTVKKNLNEVFSVRYTQDIAIDREGEDAGNVELRFKYCYLKANLPQFFIFSKPSIALGLVHQPWIEYEQKINTYRVQGEMFLNKFGVASSADFGITLDALLGGELDKETQKKVDSAMPGKYGSISLGMYNGGGYSALEMNNNKTIEGRLTLRPFPERIPGLQFSYAFADGKGNDTLNTPFIMHLFYVSHETAFTTVSAQLYTGQGLHSGWYFGPPNEGFSFFAELALPCIPLTVFGRYDDFTNKMVIATPVYQYIETQIQTRAAIGGIAWNFYKKNRLIVDIEKQWISEWFHAGISELTVAEIALEIIF
jgi:hypothetical protein